MNCVNRKFQEIKKEFNSPIEFDRLLKMKVMTWTFNLRIEELIWIFWNKLRHEKLEGLEGLESAWT